MVHLVASSRSVVVPRLAGTHLGRLSTGAEATRVMVDLHCAVVALEQLLRHGAVQDHSIGIQPNKHLVEAAIEPIAVLAGMHAAVIAHRDRTAARCPVESEREGVIVAPSHAADHGYFETLQVMSNCAVKIGVGDLRRNGHIAVEQGVRADRAVKAGDLIGVFLGAGDKLAEADVKQVAVDPLVEVVRQPSFDEGQTQATRARPACSRESRAAKTSSYVGGDHAGAHGVCPSLFHECSNPYRALRLIESNQHLKPQMRPPRLPR